MSAASSDMILRLQLGGKCTFGSRAGVVDAERAFVLAARASA